MAKTTTITVAVHSVVLEPEVIKTLRKMRLWHWREQRKLETGLSSAFGDAPTRMLRDYAARHGAYVLALDSFFPAHETAERDHTSGEYDD